MKVLVLGVTGMLGNAVYKVFSKRNSYDTWGTLRDSKGKNNFSSKLKNNLISGVDVLDPDVLVSVFNKVRPDIVINCIGLIKQLDVANDPLFALPINAMLPHRLARLCDLMGARLVHISTDCVFSGSKGMYSENENSDAIDLYGKSKYIGELHDNDNAITLRTSIIGHELGSSFALIDWFLSQKGTVKGYSKAIFSGLPTVELAHVIHDFVLPQPDLSGLYHVSAKPIDKLSLLGIVAKTYNKDIQIIPDNNVQINRSLDSTRFYQATGYEPPEWSDLIQIMHKQS